MEPYLSELRVFSYGQIPRGWLPCNGQLLAIAQNQALFSLLGTQFGGNGTTNFQLPDLRGAAPVGIGNAIGYPVGAVGGSENVTLTNNTMPQHNHLLQAQTGKATGILNTASTAVLAEPVLNLSTDNFSSFTNTTTALTALEPGTISPAGSTAPHNNMQPFLTLNICICTSGIYPSRN